MTCEVVRITVERSRNHMVISVRDSNSVDGSEPLLTASDVDTVMFRSKRNKKWYSAGDVDVFLEWVGNTLSWYEANASSSLVLAGAAPPKTIGPSISKNTIPWLQSTSTRFAAGKCEH